MDKILFSILSLFFVVVSCKKDIDTTYLITKNSVGKLEKGSLARDLEVIFNHDSIVKDTVKLLQGFGATKIKVLEKDGNHLLTLTPSSDSIPTIENINVRDPRFQTENGIGINSTFKDIKTKYTIKKIQTSLNNVVVFVNNSDVYFTIDKKELPSSLQYTSSVHIEAVQIPDAARIKYMMVGWENF